MSGAVFGLLAWVKCPRCNYDLRAQLETPQSGIIRCPECGREKSAAALFHLIRPRSAKKSVWKALLLPLPAFIAALIFVLPILVEFAGTMVGPFISITVPTVVLGHIVWIAYLAGTRSDSPSRWGRANRAFAYCGIALIYDVAIVVVGGGFLWAQFLWASRV
jgi:hypothetical protein